MSATPLKLHTLPPTDVIYPAGLKTCTAFRTAPTLTAMGNLKLLAQPMLTSGHLAAIALFCSRQCPGDLMLKTYDLAQAFRDTKIPVISGFHTPIEQDCLKILLRGTQPIIHCPARSIHHLRLSAEQQQAIHENRLLLISPFSLSYSRATVALASKRNAMIGAIAPTIVMPYAAPSSTTLALALDLIAAKKSVVTLAHPSNSLSQLPGTVSLSLDAIAAYCTQLSLDLNLTLPQSAV